MSVALKIPARPAKVADQLLLIDGKWRPSVSGKTFETVDPATNQVICRVAEGDAADIDLAVAAARRAFDSGPWSRMSGSERGRLIYKLADLVEKHQEELGALEPLDGRQEPRQDHPGRRPLLLLHQARARRRLRSDHPVELPPAYVSPTFIGQRFSKTTMPSAFCPKTIAKDLGIT